MHSTCPIYMYLSRCVYVSWHIHVCIYVSPNKQCVLIYISRTCMHSTWPNSAADMRAVKPLSSVASTRKAPACRRRLTCQALPEAAASHRWESGVPSGANASPSHKHSFFAIFWISSALVSGACMVFSRCLRYFLSPLRSVVCSTIAVFCADVRKYLAKILNSQLCSHFQWLLCRNFQYTISKRADVGEFLLQRLQRRRFVLNHLVAGQFLTCQLAVTWTNGNN